MFKHEKMLFHPVAVEKPNPQYAALLQEQLGGGNGELKAAMQYMSQSFRIKDKEIKDLFMDIAAEELCHIEMVAETINLLNGHGRWPSQVQHLLEINSIGERYPKHFLGLLLIKDTTASKSSCERLRKSVPFGKKKRNIPFVFSFSPLCHGECGSAKYIVVSKSSSIPLKSANSEPLSSVKVCIGSFIFDSLKALLNASLTE